MEVAVENGGAASESSREGTGEAAQEHVLTCNTGGGGQQNTVTNCICILFFKLKVM